MRSRLVVAVLALFGATAFAPAPFLKPRRKGGDGNEISVPTFQGTWRVTGMMRLGMDGKPTPHKWNATHVGVKGQTWTFMSRIDGGTDYTIVIKNDKKPAWLDFYSGTARPTPAPGQGIIRRKGDVVEIIYAFGDTERAASFEPPPKNQYLLTLRRER